MAARKRAGGVMIRPRRVTVAMISFFKLLTEILDRLSEMIDRYFVYCKLLTCEHNIKEQTTHMTCLFS